MAVLGCQGPGTVQEEGSCLRRSDAARLDGSHGPEPVCCTMRSAGWSVEAPMDGKIPGTSESEDVRRVLLAYVEAFSRADPMAQQNAADGRVVLEADGE